MAKFERDKLVVNGKCNDLNPKTIRRRFQAFGQIQDIEICDLCKDLECFQPYQKETKL